MSKILTDEQLDNLYSKSGLLQLAATNFQQNNKQFFVETYGEERWMEEMNKYILELKKECEQQPLQNDAAS